MERTSLFGHTIKKVSEILKIDQLYPVDQKDADKLTDLLTQCFAEDPLYCQLIPQKTMRKRLLPGLFQCDLDELFQTCHVYADSPEMNGIIIVSDETEPQNGVHRRIVEMFASWKTAALLLEDASCKTLWNFIRGAGVPQLRVDRRFGRSAPAACGVLCSAALQTGAGCGEPADESSIAFADENGMEVSLETHNQRNLEIYRHYGFHLFEVVKKHFPLKQFCHGSAQ